MKFSEISDSKTQKEVSFIHVLADKRYAVTFDSAQELTHLDIKK